MPTTPATELIPPFPVDVSSTDGIVVRYKKLGKKSLGNLSYEMKDTLPEKVEINIDPRQTSREILNTLTHELLHLYFPTVAEEYIEEYGAKISETIWREGYRKVCQ